MITKVDMQFISKQSNYENWWYHLYTLMPGPCSGKKFDINFGNRLYSIERRPGSPLLF